MFEFKEVNFVGECGEGDKRRLVFEVIFTVDVKGLSTMLATRQDKKFSVIVHVNGEFKAGFEHYLSVAHADGMSATQKNSHFRDAKDQIDLWCVDLGYPMLQRNLFDVNRDIHLVM